MGIKEDLVENTLRNSEITTDFCMYFGKYEKELTKRKVGTIIRF